MIFCSEFPVSQCQKISWGNPLVFQKKSRMEEKYEEDWYHDFLSRFFCLT